MMEIVAAAPATIDNELKARLDIMLEGKGNNYPNDVMWWFLLRRCLLAGVLMGHGTYIGATNTHHIVLFGGAL